MASAGNTILDRLCHRRAVAGWQRRADRVTGIGPVRLNLLRSRAIELRRRIDGFVQAADARLESAPPEAQALPLGTDWVWRPDPWRGRLAVPGAAPVSSGRALCDGVHLFHDCSLAEIGLRQRRNPGGPGLPPFGVEVEVFGFHGRFLSLALDLPQAAATGLGARHLVRLETQVLAERAVCLFARLNLQQGPNVRQILRQIPIDQIAVDRGVAAFDLAATGEGRVDRLWLDLIVEAPAMNRITLQDLRLSRHPRAAL